MQVATQQQCKVKNKMSPAPLHVEGSETEAPMSPEPGSSAPDLSVACLKTECVNTAPKGDYFEKVYSKQRVPRVGVIQHPNVSFNPGTRNGASERAASPIEVKFLFGTLSLAGKLVKRTLARLL